MYNVKLYIHTYFKKLNYNTPNTKVQVILNLRLFLKWFCNLKLIINYKMYRHIFMCIIWVDNRNKLYCLKLNSAEKIIWKKSKVLYFLL